MKLRTPASTQLSNQRMALNRVVLIVGERIRYRLGNHDAPGKVHYRSYVARCQDRTHQVSISDIADDERHILGYKLCMACLETIKHYDIKPGIPQRQYDVTADVAGASSHQDGFSRGHAELIRRGWSRSSMQR